MSGGGGAMLRGSEVRGSGSMQRVETRTKRKESLPRRGFGLGQPSQQGNTTSSVRHCAGLGCLGMAAAAEQGRREAAMVLDFLS